MYSLPTAQQHQFNCPDNKFSGRIAFKNMPSGLRLNLGDKDSGYGFIDEVVGYEGGDPAWQGLIIYYRPTKANLVSCLRPRTERDLYTYRYMLDIRRALSTPQNPTYQPLLPSEFSTVSDTSSTRSTPPLTGWGFCGS